MAIVLQSDGCFLQTNKFKKKICLLCIPNPTKLASCFHKMTRKFSRGFEYRTTSEESWQVRQIQRDVGLRCPSVPGTRSGKKESTQQLGVHLCFWLRICLRRVVPKSTKMFLNFVFFGNNSTGISRTYDLY